MNASKLKIILFISLSTFASCAQRKKILPPSIGASRPLRVFTPQFFLAEGEGQGTDSQLLFIFRASIARLKIKDSLIAKVTFSTLGPLDYVEWMSCPQASEDSCREGRTSTNEILPGTLSVGRHSIWLRACVERERATMPEEPCGPKTWLEWFQATATDPKRAKLIDKLLDIKNELRLLGNKTFLLLKELKTDFAQCKKTDDKELATLSQEIETQLANIESLGASFVSFAIEGLRPPSSNEALAEVIEIPSEASSEKTSDPSYVPKGLSLAEETSVATKLGSLYQVEETALSIDETRLRQHLEGNSGIYSLSGVRVESGASPQDAREHVSVQSGLLLSHPQLNSRQQVQYASYEAINAIFQLSTPDSLQLTSSSCLAFSKAESVLNAIRTEVLLLKKEKEDLEKLK